MHEITWISFDHTVPVPVLRDGFAISRDDVPLLFHESMNMLRWEKDALWIQWRDDEATEWDYAEADKLERVEVEGVEFFRIHTAPFQFNDDTEDMAELGYHAYFHPGGGIVVTIPNTAPAAAARRITDDMNRAFGMYIPERLNSWAEYAEAVPNLDRVFAFAGVERHEKEKQSLVASLVEGYLVGRAANIPEANTVRADEMAVNTVLEAVDVRWWSHSPVREVFVVTEINPAEDDMLAVTVSTKYGMERTRLVRPDRRFLVANP